MVVFGVVFDVVDEMYVWLVVFVEVFGLYVNIGLVGVIGS